MKSEVRIYDRENGEIQKVQAVSWDDWSKLDFLYLTQKSVEEQKLALDCFHHIYKNFLVSTQPAVFSQMIMFALPDEDEVLELLINCADIKVGEVKTALCYESEKYGIVSDPLIIASILLQEGVKLKKGQPVFLDKNAERLYNALDTRGFIHIVCGKIPTTKVIPVGHFAGYLSEVELDAKIKANANFFIMDPFDCATLYDQIGTPFGLCVKDGVIQNPPLFHREALLVDNDGKVRIEETDVSELSIEINGKVYIPGKTATLYTRPEYKKTPRDSRTKIVITSCHVAAVKDGGSVEVPASGFVLALEKETEIYPGDEVIYRGLEHVKMGIQAGNSIIRDGVKTEEFISQFYDIYKLQPVPYPPSLYPMDFKGARAARMAVGADAEGKPVIFWAEGKGKLSYTPGQDSTGASLSEMAEIAADLGLYNAINLDGGGSAQILVEGARALHISDRKTEDNTDAERLIPMGLVVK